MKNRFVNQGFKTNQINKNKKILLKKKNLIMSKKLFIAMVAIATVSFVSCEKESITKVEDEQIANIAEYNEISENGLKAGTYCSYPFSAVSRVSTIGINKTYYLTASQTTDK